LALVEHKPDVVLRVIQSAPATYEWFKNEWLHLAVIDPEAHMFWLFRDGAFVPYDPEVKPIPRINGLIPVFETQVENLPVYLIPCVVRVELLIQVLVGVRWLGCVV